LISSRSGKHAGAVELPDASILQCAGIRTCTCTSQSRPQVYSNLRPRQDADSQIYRFKIFLQVKNINLILPEREVALPPAHSIGPEHMDDGAGSI